jgi:hypothetical protein
MGAVKELPAELFKVSFQGPDPFVEYACHSGSEDHRKYVGGDAGSGLAFEEAARFQLEFLVSHGLKKDTVFLDLGCGCLRGGIHFINYLAAGKYLGMDISAEVVRRGIVSELGMETFEAKRPEFVISDSYEFSKFSKKPTIAFANSVFTHVGAHDIALCLSRLEGPVTLFATFTETEDPGSHEGPGHYQGGTGPKTFSRDEMHALGRDDGCHTEYIGAWGHPKNSWKTQFRHQMMFRFEKPG